MAVPTEPLILANLDPAHLTLGDAAVFDPDGFTVLRFLKFLQRHGSWTMAQLEDITIDEMKGVAEQVGKAAEALSVPKVSS